MFCEILRNVENNPTKDKIKQLAKKDQESTATPEQRWMIDSIDAA